MNMDVVKDCQRAQGLLNAGEFDEAIRTLEHALTHHPDVWLPPMMLGAVYLEGPKRDLERSIDYSNLALERDASHFQPFMNLGVAYLETARQTILDAAVEGHHSEEARVRIELARSNLQKAIDIISHQPGVEKDAFLTEQWAKCLLFLGDSFDLTEEHGVAAEYGRKGADKFRKNSPWYGRANQLAELWEANAKIHPATR